MRTGFDAVHAQGAIHVSGLLRHVQLQLATTLLCVSGNAVVGGTTPAGCLAACLQAEGREQRTGKIELPQRAKIFTKAGPAEEGVDQEGRCEIRDQEPCRAPGMVPDSKGFVRPEEQDHQGDRDPLAAQPARPFETGQA